jgi:hypothetical protein
MLIAALVGLIIGLAIGFTIGWAACLNAIGQLVKTLIARVTTPRSSRLPHREAPKPSPSARFAGDF